MRKDVFRKGMVIGIIFLFVGAGIVPCAISEVSNINETLYVYAKAPLGGDGSREHPFNTITAALTTLTMHPDEYGIIEVWEGTYEESGLRIPISMTLKGNGSDVTIIDGRNSNYIIELRQYANGTVISGFSIENSSIGIKIHNQLEYPPITINNCNIKNNEKGIYVHHSENHIIKENIIMENDLAGIYMENSDGNIVSKNKILENGNIQQHGSGGGIYMDRSNRNKIEYNEITLNNDGIHLCQSSYSTICHNNIVCNHNHGLYMIQSNWCHINKNNIYGNYVHGVHCYQCQDTDATENFWGKPLGPRVWFGIGGEGKGEILSWTISPLFAYVFYHSRWTPFESDYIDH